MIRYLLQTAIYRPSEEIIRGCKGNGMMKLGSKASCPGSPASGLGWRLVPCSLLENSLGFRVGEWRCREGWRPEARSLTLTSSASWNLNCPDPTPPHKGDEGVNAVSKKCVEEEWVKEGWDSELLPLGWGCAPPDQEGGLCL